MTLLTSFGKFGSIVSGLESDDDDTIPTNGGDDIRNKLSIKLAEVLNQIQVFDQSLDNEKRQLANYDMLDEAA